MGAAAAAEPSRHGYLNGQISYTSTAPLTTPRLSSRSRINSNCLKPARTVSCPLLPPLASAGPLPTPSVTATAAEAVGMPSAHAPGLLPMLGAW